MAAGLLGPVQAWRDSASHWRDRLLGSAAFRRWAAGFPLTRALARRRAARLFDLVGGFVYSQVLLATVRLKLYQHLADGPLPLAELARACAMPAPTLERLLAAAAALQLLEPRGAGRWGLGPLGAVLAHDEAISAMVRHHEALYADLADPLALLRGEQRPTRLQRYWAYADGGDAQALPAERVAAYSALMTHSQPLVAEQVLDAVPLQGHRCLLDVGGGEGAFVQAVAQRAPHLGLMLLDLPAVAERARTRLAAQGLARVQVHGGSFSEPLPRGADVISLVRVVHDHDDAVVRTLLRRVHEALPAGGRVLVAEPLAGTPGAAAMGDAYFGLYLLAMGQGRPRSAAQLGALLREAGFSRVQQLPTRQPLQAGVLSAWVQVKPGRDQV